MPREEAELAVKRLVHDARAITQGELTERVARIFGWRRRGPDITHALDEALRSLVRQKRLEREGELVKPGAED